MGAHLTAVNRIDSPHGFLDKGVARFALLRRTAHRLRNINGIPSKPRVVHHDLIVTFC